LIGEVSLVKRQAMKRPRLLPQHRDAMHNHRRNQSRNKHVGLAVIGVLIGMIGNSPVRGEPFVAKQEPLSDAVWQDMRGKSWKPNQGCASRDRLVLLTVPFRDFAGRPAAGELVVAKSVAAVLARIFTEIYDSAAFRIARMDRVDKYGGSDTASMAANNTSAFNCRPVEGTTTLSAHASGLAVDINPVQNPWVKGDEVDPEAGRPFDTVPKRQAAQNGGQPGIILGGGAAVAAFKRNGWRWGGDWSSYKDYQHFFFHTGH
jgi:poly-gamma-glutamate synthesis protein (capsule biosynthesis protein)